ncbi:hypothetical protein BIU97_04110 [Curtobacterium sp. MCBA15_009]|nr:hypothetical protein BIU97_04110 [Curtobacterium sp. MCBA15_009]
MVRHVAPSVPTSSSPGPTVRGFAEELTALRRPARDVLEGTRQEPWQDFRQFRIDIDEAAQT